MKRKIKTRTVESVGRWQKYRHQVVTAILASTCTAVLVPYSDSVTSAAKELFTSVWAKRQDIFSPMPNDKILGVGLRFYPSKKDGYSHYFEDLSVTIWPSQCKASEGKSIIRTFDDYKADTDTSTQAIVGIACRASGRVKVTLTPQSGEPQIIYDGVPDDGEQHPYPGVAGSYYAGILSLYWLDTKEPEGPWVPVNKCQIDNSCHSADFTEPTSADHG